MRWGRSTIAGLLLATMTGGLTGCSPLKALVSRNSSEDRYPVTPGHSKDGAGLAEVDDSRNLGTELGKSAGSVTDDEVTDSNATGEPGAFPLTNRERPGTTPMSLSSERPKPIPLPRQHQNVRRANDESSFNKILPPKSQDAEGNTPRPLIPMTPDGKRIVEGPKFIPSPYIGVRNEATSDPNLRSTPTASGALLNLGPNDSGVERAVELAKMLEAADAENKSLNNKLRALEQTLESREKMLREDEVELTKASQDLIQSRAELQKLRDEFIKVRAKLRQVEKEDLETLRTIVQALEKLLDTPPG